MDDITTIKKEIKKQTDNLKDRFDRMDEDFDRWDLRGSTVGVLSKYVGGTIPKTRDTDIRVISNAPRTFADNVQSILTSSDMQIRVYMAEAEGRDLREEIGRLERLLDYSFEKADERLTRLLLPPFKDSSVWFSMVRGCPCARILVYRDGNDVIFDFIPLDPRWLVYQRGANGLLWSAYTDSKSPEELEDEYGKEIHMTPWYKPWSKPAKSYDVIDYWRNEGNGKMGNGIFCQDVWLKEPEEYEMKSMPILIAPVPTRPPIRGASGSEIAGYGESIFAPNRDVDDLLNKIYSMWASHMNLLYKQPTINYKDDYGMELNDTIFLAEKVFNLPMGHNRLEPSPLKEVSPTLVDMARNVEDWRARGSMPDIQIGKPPPSGTLYNLVQEASNRVFNPQLRNLSVFYADICRLVEEQLLTSKIKVDVKTEKEKKYYETKVTPVDLKKPHIIKVEFTARTPWSQLDTYSVADMAKRQGLPQEFINEHILKLPDPKGLGDQTAIEMAEHSPKIAIVRAIKALIEKERFDEAKQLIRDLHMMEMSEKMEVPSEAGEQPSPIGGGETGETERALPLPEA